VYPIVAVIILNWNGWENTIECLESLNKIDYPNYYMILVDNASNDDSIQKIRDYCNGKIIPESNYIEYNAQNKPINVKEIDYAEIDQIELEETLINNSNHEKSLFFLKMIRIMVSPKETT